MLRKKRKKVTWNKFHNNINRLSLCANSYKFYNIRMIILFEYSAKHTVSLLYE